MSMTSEDRVAAEELIKLHGHIVDEGAWDRLAEIFDTDVVLDLTAFGAGKLKGIAAIRDAALALGDRNPVAHHVTNIVLRGEGADLIGRSKGFGVRSDGSVGSVVYEDRIVKRGAGWRILSRTITPRPMPPG